MAYDNRKKFWFGTEDSADWFATPLQGADSSPSAWGAEGTLLNGGGWALNSWGSHKRYSYEWPASSSRETAQRMKSYRDGTYGRGLLYFLEPTIFTTNVLPAHWADPSMSLDNEAPSLVYGVDPTPVATSGGANLGLPITSAQYDLSSVTPQTIPAPDSSVFIPIPTGHTLFLGAFYSATGTGGVFATPVNGNGTLGTAVKLTEKSNSDTDVVTDQFSGDLRGIRLWVGRSDATASTVTIAAMIGRLIETSKLPVYGPWVEQRRNYLPDPLTWGNGWVANRSSKSVQGGVLTLTTANVGYFPRVSSPEIAVTPSEVWSLSVQMERAGDTHVLAVQFKTAGDIVVGPSTHGEVSATGVVGQRLTATVTVPATAAKMQVWIGLASNSPLGTTVMFSEPLAEKAETPGPFFAPGVSPDTDTERYLWVSTPDNSPSVLETRTRTGGLAKEAQLKSGPWIGGQGHSGCRFLGTPTYVTNSPIEGGRIGFAASFVEVGSWVYG